MAFGALALQLGCFEAPEHVVSGASSGLGGTLVIGAACPQGAETCVAGATCVGGSCRPIVCTPDALSACYEGAAATRGVGACHDGQRRCDPTGTFWLEGCEGQRTPAALEGCDTAADDDCDGVANPAERCGPAVYTYTVAPGCGAWCYFDEAHNEATSGSRFERGPPGAMAGGQLVDGVRGGDGWAADLGFGPAQEWVGWIDGTPAVVLRLPEARQVQLVRIGMSNAGDGGVSQPSVVVVESRLEGGDWGVPHAFALGDGSLPTIAKGKRDDVPLHLQPQEARELRLTFTRTGWLMLDEIVIE